MATTIEEKVVEKQSAKTQEKNVKDSVDKSGVDKVEGSKSAKEKASRLKAVDLAVEQIERQFGQGSIMKLGEGMKVAVETIPTGSLSLDLALGGGIPQGRIIEIYGPESSGKTTLALHTVAEVQKRGGLAAFIDAEHALDPEYAGKIRLLKGQLHTFKGCLQTYNWDLNCIITTSIVSPDRFVSQKLVGCSKPDELNISI